MSSRTLTRIFLSLMACLAVRALPVAQESETGHPTMTKPALDVLFQLSQAKQGVKQTIVHSRLENPMVGELSDEHPYSPMVQAIEEGAPTAYKETIWSSWEAGHMSAVSEQPHFGPAATEPLPFTGFYWAGNRGVRIDFKANDSRLFVGFEGFGVQIWPQDFHGFHGNTPLVSMATYARSIDMLETTDLGDGEIMLRFPCDPTFSPDFLKINSEEAMPWIEVDIQVAENPRVLRRRIVSEQRGVFDECIAKAWEPNAAGAWVPHTLEYRYNLSLFQEDLPLAYIVFTLEHEITPEAIIDGQSIFDLVKEVGFFSGGTQQMASRIGGDRLVQAAMDTFRGVRDWSQPVESARAQLIASLRDVLHETEGRIQRDGPAWPGMAQETVNSGLVEPMQPFDMETKYCSQLGITLLRRLNEQQTTFGDVLDSHPTDLMPMAEIVASLDSAGLEFAAVHAEDIEGIAGDEPFLVLMGDDESAGHLAVAQRIGEGDFMLWAPPNENLEIPRGALKEFVPLGIYIIPTDWASGADSRSILFVAAALLALAMFVLFKGSGVKKLAGGATVVLCILAITSCGEAVASTEETALVRTTVPEYACEVGLAESASLEVLVQNIAAEEVRIVAATPSCSCIEYAGPRPLIIGVGETVELPLVIDGTVLGEDHVTLDLAVEAAGSSQLLRVPVHVTTLGKMYTDPAALRWTGRAGEEFDPFRLIAVADFDEATGEPECEADFGDARIRVTKVSSEPASGGMGHVFNVAGQLPDFEPGTYMVQLTFTLPSPERFEARVYQKRIPLILLQ